MISASGLGRSFGNRTFFAGAICLLHPGKRYRLVVADGSVSIPSVLVVAGKPLGRTAVGGEALVFGDSLPGRSVSGASRDSSRDFGRGDYSARRATIGSRRAAFRAGIKPATIHAAAKSRTVPASVSGSVGPTCTRTLRSS